MQKTFSLLLALILFLFGLSASATIMNWYENEAGSRVERAITVLYRASDLLSVSQEVGLATKNYRFTGNRALLNSIDERKRQLSRLTEEFKELVSTNVGQRTNVAQLETATTELLRATEASLKDTKSDVLRENAAIDNLRRAVTKVLRQEELQLEKHQSEAAFHHSLVWTAFGVQLVLAVGLILAVAKSLTQYTNETDGKMKMIEHAKQDAQIAKEAAETALETEARFVRTVSHEVRTPLTGVIGMAELLSLRDLGREANADVRTILDASVRLLQTLNSLLDASKLRSGKVQVECIRFPLRSLIGDVVQLVSVEARRKGLEVVGHCARDVPDFAYGDEFKVRQVLLNLAFNAVKFTERGSVQIAASVTEQDLQNTTIRFCVIDTGIGIPQNQLSALFRPFVQLKNSMSRAGGGTGLGLSISKELVVLMGGIIDVSSEVGKGSTFWFSIPFLNETDTE